VYVARLVQSRILTASATQSPATWGLDRIDQPKLAPSPLSDSFTYNNAGTGVTAYVIDTGLLFNHAEFSTPGSGVSRATSGFDAIGGSGLDCNGHGTHVGGTLGGTTYGVTKGVSLVAVRVLDCAGSGSWSGVIAGIDWVTSQHPSGQPYKPAVANMSLGGGANASVDAAVRKSIAGGVSYAIAAGNGNTAGVAQDACKSSPARVTEAMTIGATTRTDAKASWSNFGRCVDWFAPGVEITSAWIGGSTEVNTISGTSMASPHTAGVAALYLGKNSTTPTSAATVSAALAALTSKGIVSSSRTATNHLLFTDL